MHTRINSFCLKKGENNMSKKQVFVAKGSSPWYHSTWIDMIEPSHVINTDKSVSGQATVTCEDLNYMGSMFCNCYNLTALDYLISILLV